MGHKILHTSDWHLGKKLFKRSRIEEQRLFLNWLFETVKSQEIDFLVIAGDIFDTPTPPNEALELYFDFLEIVSKETEAHIIIISGNHDSANFIQAPSKILAKHNIHIKTKLDTNLDNNVRLSFSYANDASHNLQKLMAGRIDYMITGEAHLSYLVKHNQSANKKVEMSALQVFKPAIKVNPIYITVRKARNNSAGLVAAFNKGIDIIKKNGEYAQIKHKHLSSLNMPNNALPLLDFFQRIDIVAR